MGRSQRRLQSLTTRMVLSHILVAMLTSISLNLILAVLSSIAYHEVDANLYEYLAMYAGGEWLYAMPDGQPNSAPDYEDYPAGFSLVMGPDNIVQYSQGDTTCRAGMHVEDCAPEVANAESGQRHFDHKGEQWTEVVLETVLGQRAITRRGPITHNTSVSIGKLPVVGDIRLEGILNATAFIATAITILSIPVALIFSLLLVRPQMHRILSISNASRRFASGDFSARVDDHHQDEVGKLAQQFDDMAATLAQNIDTLRDLAQRNARLSQQAEQAAIQAERMRISRDLHDAIAQRLFSLSVSTSTLPNLIEDDREEGVRQAQRIAELAEQALLDLRALLLEMRPSRVIERGLPEAIQTLCDEWRNAHHTPVTCSIILTGRHIPSTVEDVIYRVVQEALSNVAKHALATTVDLSLLEGQQQITLSITDNGIGFDPNSATTSGKYGLISIRERAHSLGGSVHFESDLGRGTTMRLVLPIERDLPT